MSYAKDLNTKKRVFLCQACDSPYGDCDHTSNHQTLPKEESGRILSAMEFMVLIDSGEF